ncbi:MAG: uracil-DNA glycosylase [Anaerolineae bacterium]
MTDIGRQNVLSLETWEARVPLMAAGYHRDLDEKVDELRQTATVYPPPERVFYALKMTPFDAVRVVIVGQDPYHGPGQADGMAFSVPEGVKAPPSLRNIFKEVQRDVYDGQEKAFTTDLTRWAKQGVLLLNASLTVEARKAASHKDLGWHRLTDQIIAQLSATREHLVFMLWGNHAQSKRPLIDTARHLVLEAPHPSPLSAYRGFFGCGHFSQANAYLVAHGYEPIVW